MNNLSKQEKLELFEKVIMVKNAEEYFTEDFIYREFQEDYALLEKIQSLLSEEELKHLYDFVNETGREFFRVLSYFV